MGNWWAREPWGRWAWETVVAAVDKGLNKSTTSLESIALVAEDVAYQVKAGYA